jgi:hypothetical protein
MDSTMTETLTVEQVAPRPWVADEYGYINADGGKGMMVAMVRGWGHLTGTGALNLPPKEAAAIQDAYGRILAAAPDLLDALIKVVAVADRRTVEFDAARAAITKATGGEVEPGGPDK